MLTRELVEQLNLLLDTQSIKDYCPNGLQVEGIEKVGKVVTGVTASEALIDEAIARQANAVIVHHGYFWKNEDPRVVGMKRNRLQKLLSHNINLIAYHLPLDIHPILGNNAQLGKLLGLDDVSSLDDGSRQSVLVGGVLPIDTDLEVFARTIEVKLGRKPLVERANDKPIRSVGWCTGGGQNYIQMAAEQGMDTYITGEVSEQTIHTAREMGINFIAAGHHATERYGIKALGEYIANTFGLRVEFVDIDNPA